MNTTLFVKNASDLSISSYPASSGSGGKEWVLELVTFDPVTKQTGSYSHVLSDVFTGVQASYDATNTGFWVNIEDNPGTPPAQTNPVTLTSGSDDVYSFEGVSGPGGAQTLKAVIEDITMSFQADFPLGNGPVVIKIEPDTTGEKYVHKIWN